MDLNTKKLPTKVVDSLRHVDRSPKTLNFNAVF